MTKKITSLDEAPVDVVGAVKRGLLYRGFIPRKFVRHGVSKVEVESDGAKGPKEELRVSEKNEKESNEKSDSKNGKADEKKPDSSTQGGSPESQEEEPGETHQKLIDITEKAQDVLFTAETVFPFTLFPDTITLDREKLSVVNRFFFRVAKIVTVPITSLINAEADVGPFFGSVRMTSKYFVDNSHEINFLRRKDATEVHRLLQGFIIAQEKGVDVSEVDSEDLKALLHDLGQGASD
ncbi:hypothetical protein KW792_02590 [Candidatus Saccharibacteria bacterium]|nr:hypothetical protein [Candidatus Saccharibacteria bacterium]